MRSLILSIFLTAIAALAQPAPLARWLEGNRFFSQIEREAPPQYPQAAREAGIQGTVRITVLIGRDGKVQEARASSGPAILRPAALDAVARYRFRPYSVPYRGELTIPFRL